MTSHDHLMIIDPISNVLSHSLTQECTEPQLLPDSEDGKASRERDPQTTPQSIEPKSRHYVAKGWFVVLAIVLATTSSASAKISQSACWRNDCVQKNQHHRFCFYPSDKPDLARYPACRDPALERLVDAHIQSAARNIPTIAYYDLDTHKFLGGQQYSIAEAPRRRRIAICHTGFVKNVEFFTSCHVTKQDNDFGVAEAHKGGCGRYHGHDERVLKERCCGFPRAACPPSQESLWYKVTAGEWRQWAVLVFVGLLTLIALFLRG